MSTGEKFLSSTLNLDILGEESKRMPDEFDKDDIKVFFLSQYTAIISFNPHLFPPSVPDVGRLLLEP